jgi:hypothetical protein
MQNDDPRDVSFEEPSLVLEWMLRFHFCVTVFDTSICRSV